MERSGQRAIGHNKEALSLTEPETTSRRPLLTIAIPTWNRSGYLATNLAQLKSELAAVPDSDVVEVIVSDNDSPDATPAVVQSAIDSGMSIRYIRNRTNVGWALNFAQCFELARGRYVLLLGDDDLLVDGGLAYLMQRLRRREYGVLLLRPYGFDADFRTELPPSAGRDHEYTDPNRFLLRVSRWFTLTSACVINKELIGREVDAKQFCSTNLAAFHLVLRAALAAPANLYVDKYLIASKRQNSSSYDYAQVFVQEFWQIVDAHVQFGLTPSFIRRLERDRLLSYYPFYMLDLRLSERGDLSATLRHLSARFQKRWLFHAWLRPIIALPRPLAILWGGATTMVGRVMAGDLRRGMRFAWSGLLRRLGMRSIPRAS